MTVPKKYSLIVFLSILALVLSACGAKSSDAVIATSVALTVQAEHTQQAAKATPTEAPVAVLTLPPAASVTPAATKAPPTAPSGTGQLCTAEATFVSETIPDGTITSPGAVFTKTWRIKNSGTCPWNNTWQFVYTSGDLLGGAMYYNLPGVVMPGEILSMPVVFTAPADGGSYRGYWKIKSPWGLLFGDSGSGSAFWVDIVVGSGTPANNKTETVYNITNVTYEVTRDCTAANTFYHITAYISSNGPITTKFTWVQSDGHNTPNNTISFTSATTKQDTLDWSQHIGSSENPRWVQIVINEPTYQEFPKVTLPSLCW